MAIKFEWRYAMQKIRIDIAAKIKIGSFNHASVKFVNWLLAFLPTIYPKFSTCIILGGASFLHNALFSHFQIPGCTPSFVIVMFGVPPCFFARLGDVMTGMTSDICNGTRLRCFKAIVGVTPLVSDIAWNKFQVKPRGASPVHLLWVLFFTKCYGTEWHNRAISKSDEGTFRHWNRAIIGLLAQLEEIYRCVKSFFLTSNCTNRPWID